VPVTGDGDHVLRTRVIDNGGDASGWTTRHVRIDTVIPTDITAMSAGWQTQPVDVDVTGVDANSGVDSVSWQLDTGGTQTALGNPHTVHISGDGQHTLISTITDVAGNVSAPRTTTVRIDATAPRNTTPTAAAAWRATPYTVLLSGDDDVSGMHWMHYKIDGGATIDGPSGVLQATVTGAGTHHLVTWAEDQAGNISALRDDTINIDNVAPVDTTTAPGTPVANHYPVTIAGSDAHSGVNVVKWKLDGGSAQTGAPGTVVDIAGNGPHTLETMIVDNAGNDSGWTTTTITVDLSLTPDAIAPTDTTTTAPAGWSPGAVDMTVKATDAGTGVDYVQYRIDGVLSTKKPSSTLVTVTGDGPHTFETRAADLAGNVSAWRLQTVRIDTVQPADTSAMPAAGAWTNTRSFVMTGSDASPGSGVATVEYQIDGGSTLTVADGGTVTLPSDGAHTIWHRVIDGAGQASPATLSSLKVDTVLPANTSAAAPTAWQTTTGVSLPLTGTDALSGVDHAEWRVDGGTITASSPAVVAADGVQLLETRIVDRAGNASAWRGETVKIDRTPPVNTTPVPAGGWQNTSFNASVAGTDATSGVAGVEWKLDGGATVTTPSVSISTSGAHTLLSRIKDIAGNYSAWRSDGVGIDKVVPTLTVSCGAVDWRSTAATCSVAADGGASGLPTLTVARDGGAAAAISGGSYTVDGDGSASLTFRAVDGAGNEKLALAQVKIDRTAPAAAVSCTPGAGTTYVCAASGSDALSGLSGLTWSVDGSAGTAIANGATFAVQKGTVTVSAGDRAGNVATPAPGVLKARTVAVAPPKAPTAPKVTARTASEAVLRKGKGTIAARALGQLEISALPESTTAVLRPLALGKGSFQVSIKVTADKKSKSSTKKVTSHSGYSPQITVKTGGAVDVKVTLTVKRKSGSRWIVYATGTVKL
jgi:hypothetical protein